VSEISLPKKKQNKHNSPGNSGNTSTDDSTVEIGWDNNSPKTSQVLKQKRRLFNFLYLNFKAVLT